MKKLVIFGAAMLLASCGAQGTAVGRDSLFIGALTGEVVAQTRCPKNATELATLIAARQAFDITTGFALSPRRQRALSEIRLETGEVCLAIEPR